MIRRAFSIVELLVVSAIIAVIAAIVFPVFSGTKARAGEVVCMSNLHQLGLAMDLYREDQGSYPSFDNVAFRPYVGGVRFSCSALKSATPGNFGVYLNLFVMINDTTLPASMAERRAKLVECYEKRGATFPMLLDLNHLPKLLRPDDLLYGIVLVRRIGGSVDRIPKARAARILLALGGSTPKESMPCDALSGEGNF